jgi:hypothetical protein
MMVIIMVCMSGVILGAFQQRGAKHACQDRAQQRQENDEKEDGVHGARQPFIMLMSSTAMVPRLRK